MPIEVPQALIDATVKKAKDEYIHKVLHENRYKATSKFNQHYKAKGEPLSRELYHQYLDEVLDAMYALSEQYPQEHWLPEISVKDVYERYES